MLVQQIILKGGYLNIILARWHIAKDIDPGKY
jgi:hypothetical protein